MNAWITITGQSASLVQVQLNTKFRFWDLGEGVHFPPKLPDGY